MLMTIATTTSSGEGGLVTVWEAVRKNSSIVIWAGFGFGGVTV